MKGPLVKAGGVRGVCRPRAAHPPKPAARQHSVVQNVPEANPEHDAGDGDHHACGRGLVRRSRGYASYHTVENPPGLQKREVDERLHADALLDARPRLVHGGGGSRVIESKA